MSLTNKPVPKRLENHRKSFREMGGPLLRVSDLNPDEISFVAHILAGLIKEPRWWGIDDITIALHLYALNSWGIMCPHPENSRLYEGYYQSKSVPPFKECNWFHCQICECLVINR